MFLLLCKKILFINLNIVAVPYACILIILSAIFNGIEVPSSYLSDSKNAFNVYFMKFNSWYVIFLLLIFVTCLHLIYGFGRWKNVLMPFARVISSGVILCIVNWELTVYGSLIGTCSNSKLNDDEFICEWYGYTWSSFNVSGHIFRNLFSMLVIMEEASYYKLWIIIELLVGITSHNENLAWINRVLDTKISDDEKNTLKLLYNNLSTILRVNFCILAVLVFLLNIANLLTVIYFHTVIENTVAAVLALLVWILCYRVVFPLFGVNTGSVEEHRELLNRMETGNSTTETECLIDLEDAKSYHAILEDLSALN